MPEKLTIVIEVTVFAHLGELPKNLQQLTSAAQKATASAYAPYSGFQVGAAMQMASGEVITGSNQENAAYPSTLCAERTAAFWAGANRPGEQILYLAVAAKKASAETFLPVTPCGGCRQALLEFENRQQTPIQVVLPGPNGKFYLLPSISALLPLKFSHEALK